MEFIIYIKHMGTSLQTLLDISLQPDENILSYNMHNII